MEIQALKIFNSIKLILFFILVLGVITVLTACGDLVKESDAGACNSAIDARDYGTAKSICTDRKDIASAYMGLAGYDIINLLKSSETTVSKYTEPTALGTDDVAGATILNILQLSVANIADNDTRATKIKKSKTYLDLASSKLQPSLGDNTSTPPPLDTDEILLNTFAISFAMQLNQIMIFDNKTTSTSTFPSGSADNLSCTQVTNYDSAAAIAVLIPMDGHIWAAERDGMMCNRIKKAVEALNDDTAEAAVVSDLGSWESGDALHEDIFETVCGPLDNLTTYLSHLALNLTELKKAISLSGDNTKVLEEADNSTKILMAAVGCPKS